SATATITIGKASSTTTVTGGSFAYDGTTHAGGSAVVSGAGVIDANAAVLSYSGDRVNAGAYTVTATYAGDDNHKGSAPSATITISQRAISVTADAQTKTYGDSDPALTYQVTSGSLVSGDSFSGSLTRASGENAGTYAINQGTLGLSSNYALTYTGAS